MAINIALAGNPNCGKTTLFNALTGANQYVGNWPGVTVEKKHGFLKGNGDVKITDLPGIYSLSPYSEEEVVARNFLVDERPDAILNIVDGTNIERNLYLTTQLLELDIPMVIAVNMMDILRKTGVTIDTKVLSEKIGVPVIEISAAKGENCIEAAQLAIDAAGKPATEPPHVYAGSVEHALAHIEERCLHDVPANEQRWYAIKLFERDQTIASKLGISAEDQQHIEQDIEAAEKECGDDSETIITNARYDYIVPIISEAKTEPAEKKLTVSEKIDNVVTNRWLGLPIFIVVMYLIFSISMVWVGQPATDWVNDNLFGDGFILPGEGATQYDADTAAWMEEYGLEDAEDADEVAAEAQPAMEDYSGFVASIPDAVSGWLEDTGAPEWLSGLVVDGIIGGVGAVLGFVPQLMVLFICLAFVEECGYISRVAFVLDRLFRRFGLSGKSVIPMLIATGCGVPAVMSTRTIEELSERRMTIITTTFIPCNAKIPIISLIAGAVFGGSAIVATGAYFGGIIAILISGLFLQRLERFKGEKSPFVMELPDYHMPKVSSILKTMWDRSWAFIKKAGTIILLSTIVVWFLTRFGFTSEGFRMLSEEEIDLSIMAFIGNLICWIFAPLGWGDWQATVSSVTGLVAKENLVSTMAVIYGGDDALDAAFAALFTPQAALSFMFFNLLCSPCFAACGAIKREMNNPKWFWFAIGYQCGFAYVVALLINQIGNIVTGSFDWTGLAVILVVAVGLIIWNMVNKKKKGQSAICNCGCDNCPSKGACHPDSK